MFLLCCSFGAVVGVNACVCNTVAVVCALAVLTQHVSLTAVDGFFTHEHFYLDPVPSVDTPSAQFFKDVSIVRQLLQDYMSASREAALKLELLQKGDTFPLSGFPAEWTSEGAPRPFNPPGRY